VGSCFVIMPVSTPESFVPRYGGDDEHFRHVLDCLFVPAIRGAKLDPIPPITQGSDLIQANIIKNLVAADLVLCDISALNPNVFFELGCRTALNKPVCYVKDDLTGQIPFDNSMINHHTYQAALRPWSIGDEIAKLSKHITESDEQSKGKNRLWQYFGIRAIADALKTEGRDKVDKMDVLIMQMESLKKAIEEGQRSSAQPVTHAFKVTHAQGAPEAQSTLRYADAFYSSDLSPWTTWVHDDQKILRDAAKDLDHIEGMRTPNSPPGNLEPVKSILRSHLTSLSDALGRGLSGSDAEQANSLIGRIKALLQVRP